MLRKGNQQNTQPKPTDRIFAEWTCEEGDNHRFRPLASHAPCGHRQYIATRKLSSLKQTDSDSTERPFLGQCKECGRKKRLNEGNVKIHLTKQAALDSIAKEVV
jgi:hypothetical protein